jgi:hypothetical protein
MCVIESAALGGRGLIKVDMERPQIGLVKLSELGTDQDHGRGFLGSGRLFCRSNLGYLSFLSVL